MSPTRRRTTLGLLGLAGASLGLSPTLALAKAAPAPDDEDDIPNVFISPHGQPFRAHIDAPYPVAAWFKQADKDGDGKLDKAEFLADAEAFFKVLDRNGDGVLSRTEIMIYERVIAPEVLGGRGPVASRDGARLWLAQIETPGPIDPGGDNGGGEDDKPVQQHLDVSGEGAAPYSFFQEPEPLLAADLNLDGVIRKANFLKVAADHFSALDTRDLGYLTLAGLPKTAIQKLVEKAQHGRHRA